MKYEKERMMVMIVMRKMNLVTACITPFQQCPKAVSVPSENHSQNKYFQEIQQTNYYQQ